MTKRIIAAALALGCAFSAAADDRLARFDGGIGVIPTGSTNTTVRGVPAPGQIWVISRLSADIRTDGRILVDGRGLLLGAGDTIGTVGANTAVRARLFCGGVAFDSGPGALSPDGDFRIEGDVSNSEAAALPNSCVQPVLLILNEAGNRWFAAGIPKL